MKQTREASFARIDRVMTHLDNLIGDTNHIYQNKLIVLDAYAFVMARWSVKTPKPWSEYPNVARFMEAMQQDEAVKKFLELSNK